MRLIDADALNEDIERDFDGVCVYDVTQSEVVSDFQNIVDRQPTIEEHKIGHWIDIGSGQECSICGEIQYGYDNFRKFCPNCGADMRRERRKGQWIERGGPGLVNLIECSKCGSLFLDDHLIRSRFCPSCNADMGGEKK